MDSNEIAIRALNARRLPKLQWYEREIEKRWGSFSAIFRELREDGLKPYLATHENFEHYCQDRWNMSPRRVQQLLVADTVRAMLLDSAPEHSETIANMPEGQLREMKDVSPENVAEVVSTAKFLAAPKAMTAATIKRAKAVVIDITPIPIEIQIQSIMVHETCPTCGQKLP